MQPLAERLRPKTLDDYIGQKHLVGPGAILRKMIDAGRISSFILWGPPGVGKTTAFSRNPVRSCLSMKSIVSASRNRIHCWELWKTVR